MGKVTVSANGLTVVHKNSGGKAMASLPDVCNTPFPPPTGTIPLPYPNIAQSKDLQGGSVMTKIDGQSVALMGSCISKSTGDEPGVVGGVASGSNKGKAFFLKWSPDVLIEGRPVCRKTDMMLMNTMNTLSMTGMNQEDLEAPETKEETGTLDIELLDNGGNPVPDEEYIVKFPDGTEKKGKLDDKGQAKLEDVPVGMFKVVFPNYDEDENPRRTKKKNNQTGT